MYSEIAITAAIRKTSSSAKPESFRRRFNSGPPRRAAAIAAVWHRYLPSAPSWGRSAEPCTAASERRLPRPTRISSPSRKNGGLSSISCGGGEAVELEGDGWRRRRLRRPHRRGPPDHSGCRKDLRLLPFGQFHGLRRRRGRELKQVAASAGAFHPLHLGQRSSRRVGSMVLGSIRSSARLECSTGMKLLALAAATGGARRSRLAAAASVLRARPPERPPAAQARPRWSAAPVRRAKAHCE